MRRLKQFITRVEEKAQIKILCVNIRPIAKVYNPRRYKYTPYAEEYHMGYDCGIPHNVVISNDICIYLDKDRNDLHTTRISKYLVTIGKNTACLTINISDEWYLMFYEINSIQLVISKRQLKAYCKMINALMLRASQFKL